VTLAQVDGLDFKLLHVGVAVPEIDPAVKTLELIFGYRVISGPFEDPIQKVAVSFLTRSNDDIVEIELIAPMTTDSPIRSMLNRSGGGAYHLCFETNDLGRALAHVKSQGCILVSGPAPATAFGGRRIAWFYAPTKQLFELVEQANRS
jgi:methylmalonyl-CoA/ethylmalonyl-CoA epimerase